MAYEEDCGRTGVRGVSKTKEKIFTEEGLANSVKFILVGQQTGCPNQAIFGE